MSMAQPAKIAASAAHVSADESGPSRGTSAEPRARRAASAGHTGAEPATPAAIASRTSGVRYHVTPYGVGSAGLNPAIARNMPPAAVSDSARNTTHPTTTTSSA